MLGNVLGLLIGFMLGVLIRNSAGAIVGVLRLLASCCPTLSALLAATQQWFRDLQPWVDFNFAQGALFDGGDDRRAVGQLGVTGAIWLLVPLAVGLRDGDAVRGQVT